MRLLLDESVPSRLRRSLTKHSVRTVVEAGWSGVKNGKLLALAAAEFDAFVTVDKNLPFQQNLPHCRSRYLCSIRCRMNYRRFCPWFPLFYANSHR
jgi:predicted nuclease of predicted toxin-antitoxin system